MKRNSSAFFAARVASSSKPIGPSNNRDRTYRFQVLIQGSRAPSTLFHCFPVDNNRLFLNNFHLPPRLCARTVLYLFFPILWEVFQDSSLLRKSRSSLHERTPQHRNDSIFTSRERTFVFSFDKLSLRHGFLYLRKRASRNTQNFHSDDADFRRSVNSRNSSPVTIKLCIHSNASCESALLINGKYGRRILSSPETGDKLEASSLRRINNELVTDSKSQTGQKIEYSWNNKQIGFNIHAVVRLRFFPSFVYNFKIVTRRLIVATDKQ